MHAIRTLLSDALGLYSRHAFVAMFTWLPCVLLVAIQQRDNMVSVAIIAGVFTLIAQGILSIYELSLVRRMSNASDRTWTVEVQGADLGAISDIECAALRHHAAFSVANYLRQMVNVCEMAMNFLRQMTRAIPFLVFWLLIGGLLLDTTTTLGLARKLWILAQAYPEAFAKGVAEWLALTLAWGAFICGAFVPGAFGFCNQFRADWEHAVRRRLNLPTTERPILFRLEGNERLPSAEMAEFKAFLHARLRKVPDSGAAAGATR